MATEGGDDSDNGEPDGREQYYPAGLPKHAREPWDYKDRPYFRGFILDALAVGRLRELRLCYIMNGDFDFDVIRVRHNLPWDFRHYGMRLLTRLDLTCPPTGVPLMGSWSGLEWLPPAERTPPTAAELAQAIALAQRIAREEEKWGHSLSDFPFERPGQLEDVWQAWLAENQAHALASARLLHQALNCVGH
jgi:hypothetical protein